MNWLLTMNGLCLPPSYNAETIAKLKAMGHRVKIVDDGVVLGGCHAILTNPSTGVYTGATPGSDAADGACNGAYCPPGSFGRTVPDVSGCGLETLSGGGKMNRMSEAIA